MEKKIININDIWMKNSKCFIVLYDYANKDELNRSVKKRYKNQIKCFSMKNNEIVDKEIITNFLLQERLLLKTADGEIILSDSGKNILNDDILPNDTHIHTKEKATFTLSLAALLISIYNFIIAACKSEEDSIILIGEIHYTNLMVIIVGIIIITFCFFIYKKL